MGAMTANLLECKHGKRYHEPQWPPKDIPGTKNIDCTESRMAPMRSSGAEARLNESDSMIDRRAHKQNRDDAKEGFAGHIAPVIAQ
jgi:hypothetical protein